MIIFLRAAFASFTYVCRFEVAKSPTPYACSEITSSAEQLRGLHGLVHSGFSSGEDLYLYPGAVE